MRKPKNKGRKQKKQQDKLHASPTGLKFIHDNVYVNHWNLYIEKENKNG